MWHWREIIVCMSREDGGHSDLLMILSMFPICLNCLQEVQCPTRECQQKVL